MVCVAIIPHRDRIHQGPAWSVTCPSIPIHFSDDKLSLYSSLLLTPYSLRPLLCLSPSCWGGFSKTPDRLFTFTVSVLMKHWACAADEEEVVFSWIPAGFIIAERLIIGVIGRQTRMYFYYQVSFERRQHGSSRHTIWESFSSVN